MGAIDRRKHDIDVMERVLGTARDPEETDAPYTEVVELGISPWMAGTARSAIQLTVGAGRPEGPPEGHEDDPYESDRRGEHSYPGDKRRAPRSHREREELRSRLERQG